MPDDAAPENPVSDPRRDAIWATYRRESPWTAQGALGTRRVNEKPRPYGWEETLSASERERLNRSEEEAVARRDRALAALDDAHPVVPDDSVGQ